MRDDLDKLIDAGHRVMRWHTMQPTLQKQSVADHSWAVAMLANRLFPGGNKEKVVLLAACLEHDLAEGWVGDVPKPGKTKAFEDAEYAKGDELGLQHLGLPINLYRWLDAVDALEALLFSHREVRLGNVGFRVVITRIVEWFNEHSDEIPKEVLEFMREEGLVR